MIPFQLRYSFKVQEIENQSLYQGSALEVLTTTLVFPLDKNGTKWMLKILLLIINVLSEAIMTFVGNYLCRNSRKTVAFLISCGKQFSIVDPLKSGNFRHQML